jgi:hypothetical protein
MHIIVGFVNVMLAHYLTSLFLAVRRDFIGRMAVRRCCAGFSAGAGLDDGAMEELLRMGRPNALRLLQREAALKGERSIAGLMLKMLASLPPECDSLY